MKRYRPLAFAAALVLLAVVSTAVFLAVHGLSGKGTLSRRYAGTFAFLGTELVSEQPTTEPEYDEMSNQTSSRLDLANGGSLWVDEAGTLVEVDNFGAGGAEVVSGTLEELTAALERELDLSGYAYEEREMPGQPDLRMLVWEKQVGGYRNPYDSVRVIADAETMRLLLLRRFCFVVDGSVEPAITGPEAWEIARPYIQDETGTEVQLGLVRPDLNAGKGGVPKLGSEVRLAYRFRNDTAGVAADIDAITGDLLRLAHH